MNKYNFNKQIEKYNLEAQNFDNANGDIYSSYVGQGNYVGQYANGEPSANANGYGKLDDGERLYTVVVTNTNTSGAAVAAIVFGGDLYSGSTQPNAGVTVTVSESSHSQVRAESQRSPFWVNGLRYLTTTASQMQTQVPTWYVSESSGAINQRPFRPLSYRTAYNQITTQIDAPTFKILINGSTYLSLPVIANETVTIMFQIGGRWDASQAVKGDSPFLVANQSKLVSGIGGVGQG